MLFKDTLNIQVKEFVGIDMHQEKTNMIFKDTLNIQVKEFVGTDKY